jgi:hypothetical protein
VSTAADSSARPLRDRPLGKLAILLVVLLAAFLVSRSCGSSGAEIDQDRAITIAQARLDFEPECAQVRFVRRGIRGGSLWAVSLWTLDEDGRFEQVTLVLVNARTGDVVQVNRNPRVSATQPQCSSPV